MEVTKRYLAPGDCREGGGGGEGRGRRRREKKEEGEGGGGGGGEGEKGRRRRRREGRRRNIKYREWPSHNYILTGPEGQLPEDVVW